MKITDEDLQQIVTNVMNDLNVQNEKYSTSNRIQLDYAIKSFLDEMDGCEELDLEDFGLDLGLMDNLNDVPRDLVLSEEEIDVLISL